MAEQAVFSSLRSVRWLENCIANQNLANMSRGATTTCTSSEQALQAYLLGSVDFEAALSLQRRLHYEVSGGAAAALILCEHPPLITVGRHGSRAHLRFEPHERAIPVRWINRGGGCLLHTPGQLAIYPILPLDRLGLTVPDYLYTLGAVLQDVLLDFSVRHQVEATENAVWVGGRPVAVLGIAVRNWVSYFGAYLNIHPYLDPFRLLTCTAGGSEPMTSLERERHGPVRPALVRQRLLEHFSARFGLSRTALFSSHPALDSMQQRRQSLAGTP
jgi:lipoyl(octanoyl) transferase